MMHLFLLPLALLLAPAQKHVPPTLAVTPMEFEVGQEGRFPALSSDGSGQVHLCWSAQGSRHGETLLRHRAWNGKTWGAVTTLAHGSGWMVNWADFAKYQQDADGGAMVSWLARAHGQKGYGVMYQKRREAGAAWTEAAPLHQDREAVEHGFVSLLSLGEGRFFANWLQSTAKGPPTDLRYAVLGADGKPEEEFVLDHRVCDCCGTSAVVLPSGNVLVAYRDRSETEIRDIRVVRGMPGDPKSWTDPIAVDNEGWKTSSCPVNGPVLANDGSFVSLAYYTEFTRGIHQVRYVRSRNGGQRFGFPLIVATGKDCLGRIALAILPDGPVVISWLEKLDHGARWVACAIPRQGKPGPTVEIARVSGSRDDGFLQLASAPNGVLAAWTGDDGKSVKVALLSLEMGEDPKSE